MSRKKRDKAALLPTMSSGFVKTAVLQEGEVRNEAPDTDLHAKPIVEGRPPKNLTCKSLVSFPPPPLHHRQLFHGEEKRLETDDVLRQSFLAKQAVSP